MKVEFTMRTDLALAWSTYLAGHWMKGIPQAEGAYNLLTDDGSFGNGGTLIVYKDPDTGQFKMTQTWGGFIWSVPIPKLPRPGEEEPRTFFVTRTVDVFGKGRAYLIEKTKGIVLPRRGEIVRLESDRWGNLQLEITSVEAFEHGLEAALFGRMPREAPRTAMKPHRFSGEVCDTCGLPRHHVVHETITEDEITAQRELLELGNIRPEELSDERLAELRKLWDKP